MRILLDENTAEELIAALEDFDAQHVNLLGWKGLRNGELLTAAEKVGFQVLITVDKSMEFQQNLKRRKLAVLVLDIHPSGPAQQLVCVPEIVQLLPDLSPGFARRLRRRG